MRAPQLAAERRLPGLPNSVVRFEGWALHP